MPLSILRRRLRAERIPATIRWLAAAEGTAYWLRLVERGLTAELADRELTRSLLAAAAATAYRRRYQRLQTQLPALAEPVADDQDTAALITALYPGPLFRTIDGWLLADLGGPVRGLAARRHAARRVTLLSSIARWREVTTHLGELLIAITTGLAEAGVPRANATLGAICEEFGVWLGNLARRLLRLPNTPQAALELLRMGEYLFRVNPIHDTDSDNQRGTGHIVGNACPWVNRPGWGPMHCGIFGRFQAGCASTFGFRYALTTTIPRHGGELCRIDLAPMQLATPITAAPRHGAG